MASAGNFTKTTTIRVETQIGAGTAPFDDGTFEITEDGMPLLRQALITRGLDAASCCKLLEVFYSANLSSFSTKITQNDLEFQVSFTLEN